MHIPEAQVLSQELDPAPPPVSMMPVPPAPPFPALPPTDFPLLPAELDPPAAECPPPPGTTTSPPLSESLLEQASGASPATSTNVEQEHNVRREIEAMGKDYHPAHPMTLGDLDEAHCDTCDVEGISLVLQGRPRPVGNMMVSRILPSMKRRMLGPFVFLDHMGPVVAEPGTGFDVLPHPHIGLSTVTYLFEGEILHQDSVGSVCVIRPGDVNLMSAGKGIVHSERTTEARRATGGTMHGLQFWVAQTEDEEVGQPSFQHVPKEGLPKLPTQGVQSTLILGSHAGKTSPLSHPSRPHLIESRLGAGSTWDIDSQGEQRGIYVIEGSIEVGGRTFGTHELLVLEDDAHLTLTSPIASHVLVLGGPRFPPRFMDWNFVASSKERIEAAKSAWRAQTFPKIPADSTDYVPLPEHH